MILLLVVAALLGAVVAMVALVNPDGPTRLPRDRRRIVAGSTALAASGTVVFIGLGTLLGAPIAMLLLAITVGGSPSAIRFFDRWLRAHGHLPSALPQSAQPDRAVRSSESAKAPTVRIEPDQASMPHIAPSSLSDEALCLALRTSFAALQKVSSPTRLRIVDERRAYLNEIERRTAHGMAAWLAPGARAAGDPSRFVLGDSAEGRATIDWDDLLHDTDK